MTPLLELKDIRRSYPAGDEQVEVLKGISLDIYAGEMVAIVGASGSGKSTLMNILGCLDKATSGTYRVAGQDVATLDADALAQLRREHFGFIFQRYHLLSHLTAEQNVEVPAVYAGVERKRRLARAQELLQRLGLEERVDYYPAQLSGGQQQRVSIARALMNGGQVILADEPTGALDSHSGEEVMAILHQLRDRGHTVIIVTHDPQVAAQAERVIEIRDGEIVRNPPATENMNVVAGTESIVKMSSGWRQFVSGFNEALTMAWRALAANKMRTLLTMLGIIIGIASVVSIVVVGDAAKQMVLADIRSIGTNTIACAASTLACIALTLRLAVSSSSAEIKFCERWRRRLASLLALARSDCAFASCARAFSSAIWKGVLSMVNRISPALTSWLSFIFSSTIRPET